MRRNRRGLIGIIIVIVVVVVIAAAILYGLYLYVTPGPVTKHHYIIGTSPYFQGYLRIGDPNGGQLAKVVGNMYFNATHPVGITEIFNPQGQGGQPIATEYGTHGNFSMDSEGSLYENQYFGFQITSNVTQNVYFTGTW